MLWINQLKSINPIKDRQVFWQVERNSRKLLNLIRIVVLIFYIIKLFVWRGLKSISRLKSTWSIEKPIASFNQVKKEKENLATKKKIFQTRVSVLGR